ncbi:MAG: acetyl-CoA carboxylase biotin carboxylase subunit [Alphaproteobacteria bacterium]
MFEKILIANRGEIAVRIMRTARRLGIRTVAVYSEADASGLHVELADEAVAIGPSPAAQSYLVMDRIVDAAKRTGAQAVHPGFGFLSENTHFARRLAEEGIVFIGPTPEAIAAMGDKIESKKLAQKAGVSTVPGYLGEIADPAAAAGVVADIGYPVMIKASAGGGGKGMRVAWNEKELVEGLRSAASEARSSFGDERVFIEKFIEEPRHIEIQVLADAHGNVIHLGERECSIQRRHQKVIEEAPSPFLDQETRAAMGAQAVALARAVDYRSAGTVEFIVDKDRNFYFLEMNTRLQVEHPVTELVTGLDLVEEMIRVAAGEKLRIGQDDVRMTGWAIESRLYAEDPTRNFVPSIGRLTTYREPEGVDGVRVDSGVVEGSEISMFYDPMIAKLVTSGGTRAEAIDRMRAALDAFCVRGISHNIGFLHDIVASERFREGRLSTRFIEDEYPEGFDPAAGVARYATVFAAAAAFLNYVRVAREATISGRLQGVVAEPAGDWVVTLGRAHHPVTVTPACGGIDVGVDGRSVAVRGVWEPRDPVLSAEIDGRRAHMQVEWDGATLRLIHGGATAAARVLTPRQAELAALMPEKQPPDLSKFLLSPMPGLLLSVEVEEGWEVKAGQELCVVEAMKMENILRAERDGVVKAVGAKPGDSLAADQVIIEFA